MALVCTGEYSQYHLDQQGINNSASDEEKKEAVLSEINVLLTRVNAIYERDLALTMVLVDNNSDIIFLDPDTDDLTNNDENELYDEGNDIVYDVIGSTNFDIGHTLSTSFGGVAQLYSPCSRNGKGRGVSGLQRPIGDSFYVDFVCHEIGHQFGAEHTQNNDCNSVNDSSVEPGSASTIMGYAGICNPNIQNNSDDYFHAISIEQMWENITERVSTCGEESDTGNTAPTCNAGNDFTIPANTPFILKGNATDIDSENILTYCWEQMDTEEATMPPVSSSLNGPLFRSLPPTIAPNRYMPAIETVIDGETTSEWEVVPSVSRTLNFRLTVRDNAIVGSTASDDVTITTINTNESFKVNTPNSYVSWEGNSKQTITWNVAGTTENGINTSHVDILLSNDGGYTYPITIDTVVENDGEHDIIVPNEPGVENRIMIRATDNIFYDISDTDFEITLGKNVLSVETNTVISNKDTIKIYPNPVGETHILNIESLINYTNYKIYDVSGRIIQTGEINTDSKIDTSSLVSGMYFLNMNFNDQTKNKKLIKFIQL